MERDNLALANSLNQQKDDLLHQLGIIKRGARIASFVIEDASGGMATGEQATVSAAGMVTPPQMMPAIEQQVQVQIDEIERQLTQLGVTQFLQPVR
jgi:predicted DNA-binding transcriptional regulator